LKEEEDEEKGEGGGKDRSISNRILSELE